MVYDEPGRAASAEAPATALDNVFDDPTHGEPGRDRLGVHVAWELVLLIAARRHWPTCSGGRTPTRCAGRVCVGCSSTRSRWACSSSPPG